MELRHSQPGRSPTQRGAGRRHEPVAVGVTLDDSHELGVAHSRLERGGVAHDGVEVDDDAGLRTFEGEPSGVVGRRRGVGGGHVHEVAVDLQRPPGPFGAGGAPAVQPPGRAQATGVRAEA